MPLWPFLLISAAVALCIDLGNIHRLDDSDSLIPVLVSLQHWTPFFWGQDRWGMLVPLIAEPLRSPFQNLLFQSWVGIFSGLVAPYLTARYMLPDRIWAAAATLVNLWVLLIFPLGLPFEWFLEQPYALSVALGIGGFLLWEYHGKRGRRAVLTRLAAVFLILCAQWVNVAISSILIPLAFFRWVLPTSRHGSHSGQIGADASPLLLWQQLKSRNWRALYSHVFVQQVAVSVAAIGFVQLAMQNARTRSTVFGGVPMRTWIEAWEQFGKTCWNMIFPQPTHFLFIVLPALMGVACLMFPGLRKGAGPYLFAAFALMVSAILYWFAIGTRVWIQTCLYHFRYGFPAYLTGGIALATFPAALLSQLPPKLGRKLTVVFGCLLLPIAVLGYGQPSIAGVRHNLDEAIGATTAEILEAGGSPTLVAGGYWSVWPAVFHANMKLYDRGEYRPVYAVTYRGDETRQFWAKMALDKMRIVLIRSSLDQAGANFYQTIYYLRFTALEHQKLTDTGIPRFAQVQE